MGLRITAILMLSILVACSHSKKTEEVDQNDIEAIPGENSAGSTEPTGATLASSTDNNSGSATTLDSVPVPVPEPEAAPMSEAAPMPDSEYETPRPARKRSHVKKESENSVAAA